MENRQRKRHGKGKKKKKKRNECKHILEKGLQAYIILFQEILKIK